MNAIIKKGVLNGELNIIPSKSYSHRALIASFLCILNNPNKSIRINNVTYSNDINST